MKTLKETVDILFEDTYYLLWSDSSDLYLAHYTLKKINVIKHGSTLYSCFFNWLQILRFINVRFYIHPVIPAVIMYKIIFAVLWWGWFILHTAISYPQSQRRKHFATLSTFSGQMFRRTPFFSSTCPDIYRQNPPCYFHGVEYPSFPPYSKDSPRTLIL